MGQSPIPERDAPADEGDVLRDDDLSAAQAHCPHCLAPIGREQYYCRECGKSVGQLTGIVPFVNIPFIVDFYANAWRTLCYDGRAGLLRRAVCAFVLFAGMPFVLLGVPFALWSKARSRASEESD